MQNQDTTTGRTLINPALPLAHSANTDAPGHWEARLSALTCVRDRLIAEGWTAREAATIALDSLDTRLEEEAAAAAKLAKARERARAKAEYHLAGGLVVRFVGDAALVPSGTRGGVIHRVVRGACSCEAGQAGRACWHVEAALLASVEPAPPAPAAVDPRRVAQLLTEARARSIAAAA